jgi:hypothetical protein
VFPEWLCTVLPYTSRLPIPATAALKPQSRQTNTVKSEWHAFSDRELNLGFLALELNDGRQPVAGIQSFRKETFGGYSIEVRSLNSGHFCLDLGIRFPSHKIWISLILLIYRLWTLHHIERLQKAW